MKSIPSTQLLRALHHAAFPHPTRLALHAITCIFRLPAQLPSSLPQSRRFSSATPFHDPKRRTGRGPASREDTQTDFATLNVLGSTPPPTTAIDACLSDGFHLDNGLKVGGGSGCLLVAGEAFKWQPWEAEQSQRMINARGQWEVASSVWGILALVWPKPDLLILGLGASTYPISPETRRYIHSLGIRVDVQDTRNAAAQFNLLATERGVGTVAAALIPIGWKGN